MTSKKVYSFSLAETLGTPTEQINYGYNGNIWKDGRKLKEVKNGKTVLAAYTYDQNGIRIKKTVGSNVTKFHTDGGKILIMEKDGKEVHFLYDQEGSLFGMKVVNGTSVADYYYEKNLRGDIVGVIESTGNGMVLSEE